MVLHLTTQFALFYCLFFGLSQHINGTKQNDSIASGNNTEIFDSHEQIENGKDLVIDEEKHRAGIIKLFKKRCENVQKTNKEKEANNKTKFSPKFLKMIGLKKQPDDAHEQPESSHKNEEIIEQFEKSDQKVATTVNNKGKEPVIKKIFSRKFLEKINIKQRPVDAPDQPESSHKNDTPNIPDDCVKCNFCSDYANYNELCLFDNIVADKGNSSKNDHQKDTPSIPDDCLKCNFCSDYANYNELCFCDHLIVDKVFGNSLTKDHQKESHAMCLKCLKNCITLAHETVPFEKGALGLCCRVDQCDNPIQWRELKYHLPDQLDAIQALEKRYVEWSVEKTGQSLERCPKCHWITVIDVPPSDESTDQNDNLLKLKFCCPVCDYEMCRKCNAKWEENHANLTCEQFASSMQCTYCTEYVQLDQFCFCDRVESSSSTIGQQNEVHAFCIVCLQRYINAAYEMTPFAPDEAGLKCMAQKCANPITWQQIKERLPPDESKSISALEKICAVQSGKKIFIECPKCQKEFCMNKENEKRKFLKFCCPDCNFEMCRECNAKWAKEHNDLTCEKFARKQNKKNKKLSKDTIRKNYPHQCPKCKIHFQKIEGCNHITCNCGGQYCYRCRARYNRRHRNC